MKKGFIKRCLSVVISAVLCISAFFSVNITAYAKENTNENKTELSQTSVPQIVVKTENGNGCNLEKSDGYVNAHITIMDIDGSSLDDDIVFKVRGNTTSLYWIDKKPFTFKFDKKKNVLGMGKGKKWALIANAFDPTLLRNYLAFEIAHELEIPFTSNQKFVELWIDDSFRGNYILYEPVQEGSDRVDIDIKSNYGMKDFLVEYETETAMQNPDDTYFKAANFRFIASEPDTPNEKQLSYMQETLTDIIQTLKSGNETQIKEKIDVPSFVKYYLLNEYIKTYDFSVTSVFFYYKGAKLYAGPPWDYDLSMGNTNGEYAGRCSDANSPQGVFADKNLFIYLAHKDWFKDLVKLEYESHYDYFSQLHTDGGVLDTLRSTYSETINRNYTEAGWSASKWWINIQRQPDRTYEENYSFLKNWLYERNLWFEDYLEPFVREYLIGDADGNGVINIEDVTSIQRILAGLERNPDAEIRGNVVNDMLSIVDVTEIQKYIANYENIYSIGDKTKAKFEMCY